MTHHSFKLQSIVFHQSCMLKKKKKSQMAVISGLMKSKRQVEMTEVGYETVEDELIKMGLLAEGESLYSPSNLNLVHHVSAAIRAHFLYQRNVHYIVHDGEVIIVDENTGRTMPGRRWSEGLHQAVEAKEALEVQPENQTLATTTFQNYFRL